VINTWIGKLEMCSFVLENSLRMALQCQNMQEFDTYHDLYCMIYVLLYVRVHFLVENIKISTKH